MSDHLNDHPEERMRMSHKDEKTTLARTVGPQLDHETPDLLSPEAARMEGRAETERSMLAVQTDPSLGGKSAGRSAQKVRRGVSWVRPVELVARSGARAAGRGIDLQAELTRRLRDGVTEATRRTGHTISERARRLPDLSMFARDYPATETTVERPELGFR